MDLLIMTLFFTKDYIESVLNSFKTPYYYLLHDSKHVQHDEEIKKALVHLKYNYSIVKY